LGSLKNIRFEEVFGYEDRPKEEKLKRAILIRILLLTCFFAVLWAGFYVFLGLFAGASVVGGYALVSFLNLALYRKHHNYPNFRFNQLILILLLPTLTQIMLGGFNSGSGVIMAAMLCPLGALMFHNARVARKMFYAYVVAVVIAGATEIIFPQLKQKIDPLIIDIFFVLNFVIIGFIVFALLEYFMQQKEIFRALLAERNKDITDSIRYAKHLQQAILPSHEDLKEALGDGFVLFLPKDVVSGDFYWMQEEGDTVYFAAADCTGHGVPGAMVSLVCGNSLNRSLKEFNLKEPKDILNKTRELVIETFARSGKGVKDGMDIALCAKKGNHIRFAGANNALWIISERDRFDDSILSQRGTVMNEQHALVEIKGDKQPIGLYEGMKDFEQHEINLNSDDKIYLYTDGYADQFGGERNKKLMYKPFKKLLLKNHQAEMDQQKENLKNFFHDWKGDNEQIDDVCVIGIKI
jgi:serine phosphatase RsbU (regulator of sigma subunit)